LNQERADRQKYWRCRKRPQWHDRQRDDGGKDNGAPPPDALRQHSKTNPAEDRPDIVDYRNSTDDRRREMVLDL